MLSLNSNSETLHLSTVASNFYITTMIGHKVFFCICPYMHHCTDVLTYASVFVYVCVSNDIWTLEHWTNWRFIFVMKWNATNSINIFLYGAKVLPLLFKANCGDGCWWLNTTTDWWQGEGGKMCFAHQLNIHNRIYAVVANAFYKCIFCCCCCCYSVRTFSSSAICEYKIVN